MDAPSRAVAELRAAALYAAADADRVVVLLCRLVDQVQAGALPGEIAPRLRALAADLDRVG